MHTTRDEKSLKKVNKDALTLLLQKMPFHQYMLNNINKKIPEGWKLVYGCLTNKW